MVVVVVAVVVVLLFVDLEVGCGMMMLIDTMIDMTINTITMRVPHQLILIHSNQLIYSVSLCA